MRRGPMWAWIGLPLILALFLVGCSSGTGGDSANSGSEENGDGEVYQWDLGTVFFESHHYNSYTPAIEKFIEMVDERTDGKIKITPYFNSTLGGDQELFQSVSAGELEVFYGALLAGADPRFGIWNLPFLFRDHDHIAQLLANPEGEFFKLTQEWLKDHNVYLIASGIGSFRGLVNNGHQVVTPDDVKGLKLRTMETPIATTFWNSLGEAIALPADEIYMSLETKMADGLEFHPAGVHLVKLYEVADYFTDINWWANNAANIMISAKAWEALPKDLQKIVEEAAWEAMELQGELEIRDHEKAIDEMEELGVQVHRLTPEERQLWFDHAQSLSSQFREMIGPEIYDEVMPLFE